MNRTASPYLEVVRSRPGLKTAVIHPAFKPAGGSEYLAVWLCEALRETGLVTLASNLAVDLGQVDRIFGTSLASGGVKVKYLPPAGIFKNFDALSAYRLSRWAKVSRSLYDLMISTYNPVDFGQAGIQFLADVSFEDELRRRYHPKPAGIKSLLYGRSFLRNAYLGLGRLLAGQSGQGWKRNLTVANSFWTKQVYEERFGLEAAVIYPPVPECPEARPWPERDNGFVVMSRIVPEKGLESAISIIRAVRSAGYDVHLHILGRADDQNYLAKIDSLCRESGGWAHYEGPRFGEEKARFLAAHKFGLSACRGEAFGISVAEMVKAGMIAWVPAGGGQVEVVDCAELVYGSEEEAAALIISVLKDEAKAEAIRNHLARRAELFSTGRFVQEARALVRSFLERSNVGPS